MAVFKLLAVVFLILEQLLMLELFQAEPLLILVKHLMLLPPMQQYLHLDQPLEHLILELVV
jgi:hypothetical protein